MTERSAAGAAAKTTQAEQALIDYLHAVHTAAAPFQIAMLTEHEPQLKNTLRLEKLYFAPHIDILREAPPAHEAPQQSIPHQLSAWLRRTLAHQAKAPAPKKPISYWNIMAIRALQVAPQRRLLLLGHPGSGKSTFIRHLLLCLSGAALAERNQAPSVPEGGWLRRLYYGWEQGALIPIPIILSAFAAYVQTAPPTTIASNLFEGFLRSTVEDAAEPLITALRAGKAILLLDGLEELQGSARPQVIAAIAAAAATYVNSPIVVTCRERNYTEQERDTLPNFPTTTLAKLAFSDDANLYNRFVHNWYRELTAAGQRPYGTPLALAKTIFALKNLCELAQTPLFLTCMATIHSITGELPATRALLYAECINLLLFQWQHPPDHSTLLAGLPLLPLRQIDLLRMLAEIAFHAHTDAEQATYHNTPAGLPAARVTHILERFVLPDTTHDPTRRSDVVRMVLQVMLYNELLVARPEDTYALWQLAFQHFLAGYHLATQNRETLLAYAARSYWHEPLRLMIGYQMLHDGNSEHALELIHDLLQHQPLLQILAGELVLQIGYERATLHNPQLWGQTHQALQQIATGSSAKVPPGLRIRAGLALGLLSYGPISALSSTSTPPLPDQRLPFAMQTQNPHWRTALDAYWCPVPAGVGWFHTNLRGTLKQISCTYDYAIGRYQITNAEFAYFIAAGGYDLNQPWWTPAGLTYMRSLPQARAPYDTWEDLRFNNPLQPVVGIMWYEAIAYCGWLTQIGHAQGWLSNQQAIRLPTACEWEHAARGNDQRRYPWGQYEPMPMRTGYREVDEGALFAVATAPIGCFPSSQAACGAEDLAGNVAEWLATRNGQDEHPEPVDDTPPEGSILLVESGWEPGGGIFEIDDQAPETLYWGIRVGHRPTDRIGLAGFRVVVAPVHPR